MPESYTQLFSLRFASTSEYRRKEPERAAKGDEWLEKGKKKGEEIKPSSRIILKIKVAQKTINKKR